MNEKSYSESLSKMKMMYDLWVVFGGFILLGILFIITVALKAENMTTALGAITTVVGTVVGAYLGVTFGSAGKQDAIRTREDAIGKLESKQEKLTKIRVDYAQLAESTRNLQESMKVEEESEERMDRLNNLIKRADAWKDIK